MRPGVWIVVVGSLVAAGCGTSAGSDTTGGKSAAHYNDFLSFSVCMRSHGVPSFPDPSYHGGINIGNAVGLDPQSPTFRSAQQTCKHLLLGGGPPSHESEAQKEADLAFARCMRANGIPGYPDPLGSGGGRFQRATPLPPGVDENSPAFQKTAAACQK